MRRIRYAGGTFLTGDREAEAILRYAAALANANRAAPLSVPGLDEDGHVDHYEILMGPASQIMAEPAPHHAGLPAADELVGEIDGRLADLEWRPPAMGSLLDYGV
jgi:hypothetical protein